MRDARGYAGAPDLDRLLEFTRRALAARWPGTTGWHVGDVIWMLGGRHEHPNGDLRLWMESGDLVGIGWLQDPLHLRFDLRADLEGDSALLDEILAWGERRARARPGPTDGPHFSTWARESEASRAEALTSRGYARSERGDVYLRRSLETPVPAPPLPAGMRLADCVDVDLDERVDAHRDAWSHLEHLGLPHARSSFTPEVYRGLRAAPLYDPQLDLVIETEDRVIASCAIGWADHQNAVGLFEPVGTRYAHRGRGLARAVNLEGLRRFRERGLRWASVGTALHNHAAHATYRACGFEMVDRGHYWVKRL